MGLPQLWLNIVELAAGIALVVGGLVATTIVRLGLLKGAGARLPLPGPLALLEVLLEATARPAIVLVDLDLLP